MPEEIAVTVRVVLVFVLLSCAAIAFGQEKIDGTVVSTKLTRCTFKPGGCEGSLVLETQRAGKPEQVAIKVPLGTQIKKGNEYAYLPALRGNVVSVVHVTANGERVAQSIEVIQPAKP